MVWLPEFLTTVAFTVYRINFLSALQKRDHLARADVTRLHRNFTEIQNELCTTFKRQKFAGLLAKNAMAARHFPGAFRTARAVRIRDDFPPTQRCAGTERGVRCLPRKFYS